MHKELTSVLCIAVERPNMLQSTSCSGVNVVLMRMCIFIDSRSALVKFYVGLGTYWYWSKCVWFVSTLQLQKNCHLSFLWCCLPTLWFFFWFKSKFRQFRLLCYLFAIWELLHRNICLSNLWNVGKKTVSLLNRCLNNDYYHLQECFHRQV